MLQLNHHNRMVNVHQVLGSDLIPAVLSTRYGNGQGKELLGEVFLHVARRLRGFNI